MSWLTRLRRDLPPLTRMAAREPMAELARALQRAEQEHGGEQAVVMAQALPGLTRELIQVEEASRAARESLAIARSTGNEHAAVVEILTRFYGGRQLAEDLRATHRHLDAEALEDRMLLREQAVHQRWEILARALASTNLGPCSDDDLLACRDAAASVARGQRPWPVRTAACALVGVTSFRPIPGMASGRQLLLELSHEPEEDVWVQAEALAAWLSLQVDDPAKDAVLEGVALPSPERLTLFPADHAFVRARAARLAGEHRRWGVLRRMLATHDPSEHVRMAVGRALLRSRHLEDLVSLTDLVPDPELSPRHRASIVVHSLPPHTTRSWLPLVTAALNQEDPEVWRIVLRAVLDHRHSLPLVKLPSARRLWGMPLERLQHEPGDVGEWAAALALWLEVRSEPSLSDALRVVEAWLEDHPQGSSGHFSEEPVAPLEPGQLLDVLALAALDRADLSANPSRRGGWQIHHGSPERPALWRLLHELSHPRTNKRQAHTHLVDQVPRGHLVAPSSRLAEVTPTQVPGQRVSGPTELSWGAELPLPSLLLAGARRQGVWVRTPSTSWEVHPAGWAPLACLRTHLRYTSLASLRSRLRASAPGEGIQSYDQAIAQSGLRIQRHHASALGLLGLEELVGQLVTADANTVTQLAVLSAAVGTAWLGRELGRERRARSWRRRLPLVIGGWGSRGKSGTERLKAAVFHGLGYTVVSKTTGCEAMVLTSLPGRDPVEVFLYRPYDKATIVEQRATMALAAELGAQVFLWECMALNPYYVRILQADWTRDDLTTITNTYPDHEDIQGPAGTDVARVIAQMLPPQGRAISTEQHMSPVLEHQASQVGCHLEVVQPAAWELLPADVVARIPYDEHPRNIALVVATAADLGVPEDVALKAMADHVIPDIGVLKEYGPVRYEERDVSFVNGMSANERAGFLSNWQRMDMGARHPGSGLDEHVVVIVNNRADRLARQAVFSHIAAMDAVFDTLVFIGTNVGPFRDAWLRQCRTTLADHLRDLARGEQGRQRLLAELGRRLRREPLSPEQARARIQAAGFEVTEPASGRLVQHPAGPERTVQQATAQWMAETAWLHELSQSQEWEVEPVIAAFLQLISSRVVPVIDARSTGDQVLHTVATTAPPGARVRALGCSNIKGTGLDFVYRWLSVQVTLDRLGALEQADAPRTQELLRELAADPATGVADTQAAVTRLGALLEEGHFQRLGVEDEARTTVDRLTERLRRHRTALRSSRSTGLAQGLRDWTREALDFWDSTRRRREAEALYRDLAARRVGLGRAAAVAKGITTRQ